MEWVYSSKGKKKLSYEGYIYGFQKQLANNISTYECELRRDYGCKAKLKVQGDDIVGSLHTHTHAPDGRRGEVMKTLHGIKRRAEETLETPQQILTTDFTVTCNQASKHSTQTLGHFFKML